MVQSVSNIVGYERGHGVWRYLTHVDWTLEEGRTSVTKSRVKLRVNEWERPEEGRWTEWWAARPWHNESLTLNTKW